MAIVITGSAISSKVLQRQNFSKEPNGLETIIEAYAIKTENRDSVIPEKNTLHSVFSSSTKKYSRMVVESVTTEEQDGGITQMLVTYVGLTLASGLPPAIVRIIPTPDAGIYGPPMVIEAEFVTDRSESNFALNGAGGQALDASIPPVLSMPTSINGIFLPNNPRAPFVDSQLGYRLKYFGYVQISIACEKRGLFLVARTVFQEKDSLQQF